MWDLWQKKYRWTGLFYGQFIFPLSVDKQQMDHTFIHLQSNVAKDKFFRYHAMHLHFGENAGLFPLQKFKLLTSKPVD